jgi:hypothetical protein
MKITLSTNQIADHLYADKDGGWSWGGAHALAEELEALEEGSGEEMELDVIAIRCDYSEYASGLEAAEAYGYEKDEEDEDTIEEAAVEWLRNKTSVIEFSGGVITQSF